MQQLAGQFIGVGSSPTLINILFANICTCWSAQIFLSCHIVVWDGLRAQVVCEFGEIFAKTTTRYRLNIMYEERCVRKAPYSVPTIRLLQEYINTI